MSHLSGSVKVLEDSVHGQRLVKGRKGRVQQQTIQVVRLEVAKRRREGLAHLVRQRRVFLVGYVVCILALESGELGLQEDVSARQPLLIVCACPQRSYKCCAMVREESEGEGRRERERE